MAADPDGGGGRRGVVIGSSAALSTAAFPQACSIRLNAGCGFFLVNRDVQEKVRRLPFLFLSIKDASLAWHELYQEVVGLHSLPLFGTSWFRN